MRSFIKVQRLVYKMLTENTGSHGLDSGGYYGRNHERNSKKTIEDFRKEEEATLTIEKWNEIIEASITLSVFHFMTKKLSLDKLCDQFNKMKVRDWDSDKFYGVSIKGEKFLNKHFHIEGNNWNTCNWESNLSQVLQGCDLKCKKTGDIYILVQVHGGCDVRGGYTDAKLFKLDSEFFLSEDCIFDDVDYMGEFITPEGSSIPDNFWNDIAKKYNIKNQNDKIVLNGTIYEG
jgi:hypothetical protein